MLGISVADTLHEVEHIHRYCTRHHLPCG